MKQAQKPIVLGMNIKRIAAVSLTYEDFSSFEAKLEEAARLVTLAARQGAELVGEVPPPPSLLARKTSSVPCEPRWPAR